MTGLNIRRNLKKTKYQMLIQVQIMSEAKVGENNHNFAKTLSEEKKQKNI
jgi:hypothetical protein